MAATKADRIKQLLGQGLSPEVVASTVGVDPSYISQLYSDPNFRDSVVEQRTIALTGAAERDAKLNAIEDKILDRLKDNMEQIPYQKTRDLLHALSVVNGAKRRGISPLEQNINAGTEEVVRVVLPARTKRQLVIDATGQVVGVDNQTMVTMNSRVLLSKLSAEKGDSKYVDVTRYLPGGKASDAAD